MSKKKLSAKERQRRISEGLRLHWKSKEYLAAKEQQNAEIDATYRRLKREGKI